MKDNWEGINDALISTSHEVLDPNKHHHHMEWISMKNLDKIEERKNKKTAINNSRTRTKKMKTQAEQTETNEQVKKSIRANKQKHVEDLATT
ncbi:unnamed protein product [Schistosoma margrebowiei]|uniref:Uncharacterized protein n=1 Tax=Schistosoma margrebowiei TaxID=48269 RepID=A0A183LEI1_9TREM|nr:unnamed protein product [Schistosoma margrebowiei]